ncbi:MAG: type V CRISPR-associated protein Cas12k [Cyanobacteria bacterium P01_D01_bin.50]
MSVITVQCRVVASEATRHHLWQIMVQKNTPLINELLKQVGKQAEFEQWLNKGKLPSGIVRPLCNSLIAEECFSGQPKRFYKSAIEVTEYIYKSWLARQKKQQRRLDGKIRWLSILKSDEELVESSGRSLENIKEKALEILVQSTTQAVEQQKQNRKNKKGSSTKKKSSKKLLTTLFEAYEQTEDDLERYAIVYLLKNNCEIPEKEEDPEKFAQKLHKKEIEIERLRELLTSRMPHGRDLTGEEWLKALSIAANTVPENEEEARLWQNRLLKKPSSIPFPIQFTSNEDFIWSKNDKGRICFKLSGLNEHIFEIFCDSPEGDASRIADNSIGFNAS